MCTEATGVAGEWIGKRPPPGNLKSYKIRCRKPTVPRRRSTVIFKTMAVYGSN